MSDQLKEYILRNNLIQGSAGSADNVVQGAAGSADNVVQGAAGSADNVVQGVAGSADNAVQGAAGSADNAVQGAAGSADNVVQGAAGSADNTVQGAAQMGNYTRWEKFLVGRESTKYVNTLLSDRTKRISTRMIENVKSGIVKSLKQQIESDVVGQADSALNDLAASVSVSEDGVELAIDELGTVEAVSGGVEAAETAVLTSEELFEVMEHFSDEELKQMMDTIAGQFELHGEELPSLCAELKQYVDSTIVQGTVDRNVIKYILQKELNSF